MCKSTENNALPLIIGLGNEFRGDDGFGLEVVRRLREQYSDLAEYVEENGDITRLTENWKDRNVILIDAVQSPNQQSGEIHQALSIGDLSQNQEIQFSTHGIGIREAFEFSTLMNQQPRSFFFIGVEGTDWKMGHSISSEVSDTISVVIQMVLGYLNGDSTL